VAKWSSSTRPRGSCAGADNGTYAAMKHASGRSPAAIRIRNQYGVRVLSVYPGRTATRCRKSCISSRDAATSCRIFFSRAMLLT